jgi:hypothetical protein
MQAAQPSSTHWPGGLLLRISTSVLSLNGVCKALSRLVTACVLKRLIAGTVLGARK